MAFPFSLKPNALDLLKGFGTMRREFSRRPS
jgi:hypothetical protein